MTCHIIDDLRTRQLISLLTSTIYWLPLIFYVAACSYLNYMYITWSVELVCWLKKLESSVPYSDHIPRICHTMKYTMAWWDLIWCNWSVIAMQFGKCTSYRIQSTVSIEFMIKWKHFRVTGPVCGEFTGPGEFPAQRPVTRSFDVFFDLRPNKRLSKQPRDLWFGTLSWSLWRQCNVSPFHKMALVAAI